MNEIGLVNLEIRLLEISKYFLRLSKILEFLISYKNDFL